MPTWYERTLCQPAVAAVCNCLDRLKAAALATSAKLDQCQISVSDALLRDVFTLTRAISTAWEMGRLPISTTAHQAEESLREDNRIYTGSKNKAESKDKLATAELKELAHRKEIETQATWKADERPPQPGNVITVAQVKLQAVKAGPKFRAVVDGIGATSGCIIKHPKLTVNGKPTQLFATKEACERSRCSQLRFFLCPRVQPHSNSWHSRKR